MKKITFFVVALLLASFTVKGEGNITNVPTLLLSDCQSMLNTNIGTFWYFFDDQNDGGLSTSAIEMTAVGNDGSVAANCTYILNKGTLSYNPFIGFGFATNPANDGSAFDFSPYTGFSFYHKGSTLTVELVTTNVLDNDNFNATVPAHTAWTLVTIPWATFRQFGWGKKQTFSAALISKLHFTVHGANGQTGTINLDNIKANGTSTAVSKVFDFVNVSAYPNPFTNSFQIESGLVMNSVIVRDLTGKQILNKMSGSNKMTIDATNFAIGLYFLDVDFGNGIRKTMKITKK